MTTQYTTILKLALPVQGELSGTWGDVVNDNITQMVEQAIAGKATVNSWTANSHTLTTADGTTSESRCAILELTDSGTALTGAGTVICPTNTKLYIVDNNTAQIVTVKTSGGTGIAVPVGKTMLVYCDGTNVVEGVTHANSLSLGTSTVTADKILDEDNMASDSATAIATQQSIKAYVDSQVGSFDTLAEVLAQGNTTGGTDIAVGTDDDITFTDSSKAIFGADSDLQIYHDGSHSRIADRGTGDLRIYGDSLQLNSWTSAENYLTAATDGAVAIYYNGSSKLATTDTGIDVTGTAVTDGVTVAGNILLSSEGNEIQFNTSSTPVNKIYTDDTYTSNGLTISADNGVTLKSTNNYLLLDDTGTNEMVLNVDSGERMRVTATGIDVTGTVTADGLTVDASSAVIQSATGTSSPTPTTFNISTTSSASDWSTTSPWGRLAFYSGDGSGGGGKPHVVLDATASNGIGASSSFSVSTTSESANTLTKRLNITYNGDISFYEDTGTTPKFVWDASDESLMLGSGVNTYAKLTIAEEGTSVGSTIRLVGTNTIAGTSQVSHITSYQPTGGAAGDAALDFKVRGGTDTFASPSTVMTLLGGGSGGGKVGIGTTSIGKTLTVAGTGLRVQSTASADFYSTGQDALIVNNGTANLRFWTNSEEAMRIDTSGRVLINKTLTTGSLNLEVQAPAGFSVGSGFYAAGSQSTIAFKDGNTTAEYKVRLGSETDDLLMFAGGSERLRIDSSGHAIIPAGVTLGTATGVYNAANTLEDYEEGTWTPVYAPATGSFASITMDSAETVYTKVGRMVTVSGIIRTDDIDVTGGSGAALISGLPFPVAHWSAISLGRVQGFGGDMPDSGYGGGNAYNINLYYRSTSNGATTALNVTDLADGTGDNSNYIFLEYTYQTTA